MYQTVYIPQFSNREDLVLTVQIFDDDTGEPLDLDRIATASGQTFSASAWTVTSGNTVTTSATAITLPAFPIGDQLSVLALTVGVGLEIKAGDPVKIKDTATGLNTMSGYVKSYGAATGALVCQINMTFQFEVRKTPPNWQPGLDYSAFYDFGVSDETPILQASLANGQIFITDVGALQIRIPESSFRSLRGGTYAACLTMTDGFTTRQVFIGQLPVLWGGVTN
jgi:hypothetical protein